MATIAHTAATIETTTPALAPIPAAERELSALFDELFPIFRSLTGAGFERSLAIFARYLPLSIERVASGSQVFDWIVPPEWRIHAARLTGPDGAVIADIARSNLAVVNYSEPVDRRLSLDELRPHLHSVPTLAEAIPYVTSYYTRQWGFCLPHRDLERLPEGEYHARIESEFVPGAVTLGHCTLPGETDAEILLTSYLCHPSLANNELSGPLALLLLYDHIARWPRRRFTYRFQLNPETIGSLCFLHLHGEHLRQHLAGGLVLTCLGGPCERLTYQVSRRGGTLLDCTVADIRSHNPRALDERPFDPTDGSDERQYCSPGFNLPMGQMARTVYGRYPEYHTSLDDKAFMDLPKVIESARQIEALLARAEISGTFRNLQPYGEPQLGRRGLFPSLNSPTARGQGREGQPDPRLFVKRMMAILNFSGGDHTMIDIAHRLGTTVLDLAPAIETLERAGLLAIEPCTGAHTLSKGTPADHGNRFGESTL
jgi:aminopeptidase-like protein